jgi:hypothetical protein
MNPFINVFTDTVDFDQVEWDEFTSFIATTDDIKLLLFRLNETASYHESEKERDWALRMYAWVVAMTNNELAGSK